MQKRTFLEEQLGADGPSLGGRSVGQGSTGRRDDDPCLVCRQPRLAALSPFPPSDVSQADPVDGEDAPGQPGSANLMFCRIGVGVWGGPVGQGGAKAGAQAERSARRTRDLSPDSSFFVRRFSVDWISTGSCRWHLDQANRQGFGSTG